MPRDPFDTWNKFIAYFRVALTAVFLPMFLAGAILFSEVRLVAIGGIVVLSYFLYRDIRTIRRRRTGAPS